MSTPTRATDAVRRILFIASRADIAGGEVYLLDVLRHLDTSRFVPVVAVPKTGSFSDCLAQQGIETLVLGADYGWLKPAAEWAAFLGDYDRRVRLLRDFLVQHGVALVHTNSNQVFEGALAARLASVHHVHVVHIPFQADLPIYQRVPIDRTGFAHWVDDLSSAIVAVAEPVAASLCPPVSREKVTVIHNGVDLDHYRGARAAADGHIRRELGIPASAPLVVGAGRLHPDKGFLDFVDAAAQVLRDRPDAWFVIAGGADADDHERRLRQRMVDHGVEARVRLLGFRQDLPRILAEADVFLLTSLSEGGPYVLLEAVASGCVCVASRCGGFVEHVIRHRASGFLFDVGDPAAAAHHVLECLADPELAARLKAAAEAVVYSGEFDVRNSVAKLAALYDHVLGQPVPASGSSAIGLLLQLTRELGQLGADVAELKQRMKRAERAADLVLDNPLTALARRLKRGDDGKND